MKIRDFTVLMLISSLLIGGCTNRAPAYVSTLETERITEEHGELTSQSEVLHDNSGDSERENRTKALIVVYVCGAVENPGIYSLEEGSRIFDAVSMAGGFLPWADQNWLNLAEPISDGQKIYIYTEEETAVLKSDGQTSIANMDENGHDNKDDGLVNLNTATKEELMALPGIGEARAQAIIAYREKYGSFQSIEEIQNISGIKGSVFSSLKELITV